MIHRGVQPTPRVLLIGDWYKEEVDAIQLRFAVVHGPYPSANGVLRERLHSTEIDLVAIADHREPLQWLEAHLERSVILFCGEVLHSVVSTNFGTRRNQMHQVISTLRDTCSQSHRLPSTQPTVHQLRSEALGTTTDVRGWWSVSRSPYLKELRDGALILANQPEDAILGSICWRENTNSGLAWIPFPVPDRIAWIDAIVSLWAERDRASFATVLPWGEQLAWLTPQEKAIRQAQAAMDQEEQDFLRDLANRRGEAQRSLLNAQAAAQQGIKRLLTDQSDSLVDIVRTSLIEIGFHVTDSDTHNPVGRRAEDLLVRDPNDPEWVAVVEVKGFEKSGGSPNDLRKLDKHVHRYERTNQKPPSAKWFIVNGQFQLPPSARALPFASDPHQVEEWAGENGLLISTVELYRSLIDPNIGPSRLRDALKCARGQFRKPL